jgi:CheY-like chemotaxis protein
VKERSSGEAVMHQVYQRVIIKSPVCGLVFILLNYGPADDELDNYWYISGMTSTRNRVLIVSSHPLFGQGLRRLLQTYHQNDVDVVGTVTRTGEAMQMIEVHSPDLVVVDYDDEQVDRDAFLAQFVAGERKLRVVLLSLKEGGSQAVVYDRRSLSASQIEDWLDND